MHASGVRELAYSLVQLSINVNFSCKDCIVSFLETCSAKGEDGRCPICSHAPVTVSIDIHHSPLMKIAKKLIGKGITGGDGG
jgi:hypothetical protein